MSTPQSHTGMHFASALTSTADTFAAGDEIVETLGRQMTGEVDLMTVYLTPDHREHLSNLYDRLQQTFKPRVLIGCTAGGVLGGPREVESGPAVSVLAATLPEAHIQPFSYEQLDWPKALASPTAMRESLNLHEAEHEPKAIILLADPFSTPLVKLLPAINDAFPGVPVVGGMASGGKRPKQNRLLLNGTVLDEGAVGVAISGNVAVQTTVSQGCRPVGKPLVITKARRHVVQQLAGRNALEVIQEMAQELDGHDQELVETAGLLVGRVVNEYKSHFGRGDFLIRGLVGVDPKQGYIAIGDPQVRVGQTVQFHVRDQKTASDDFAMLLEAQRLYGPGEGAMLFTCASRGSNLFDQPNVDVETVRTALGDVPMAGFFAAGELGPLGAENFVHGHTASLLVFRQPEPQWEGITPPLPDRESADE
ncbi:FIST N-terminal domain-containing protein [Phycisphaerales bacterium AB-hyl4]|uniref:FIST N-terminal domain-containing protein n=1 Tax=Natronomicrosphaera hydrolytica TaxID=3242702 RepID=A0ABV4U400_9BACT